MLMVVFEVRLSPVEGHAYLDIAGALRPELLRIEGFIGNERWRRPGDPDAILALSTWSDEAAVIRWRRHVGHRVAQRRGRDGVFSDYRLRVGEATEAAADIAVVIGRGDAPAERYDALSGDGRWAAVTIANAAQNGEERHRLRIVRDYGMHRREHAPPT